MIKKYIFLLLISIGTFSSCTRYFIGQPAQMYPIAISDTLSAPDTPLSSQVSQYLNPYKDSLSLKMNTVLIQSARRLTKAKPESELGNLMTDIMLEMGAEKLGKPVDVAMTNYGGIRTDLPAGNVTIGNVFEVMPFDNALVAITLSGEQMQKVATYIAQGKEPQAGLKLVVGKEDNQLKEALIKSKPIDPAATYTFITSDYVATSSDLAPIVKNNKGYQILNYLVRDAMIDYLRRKGEQKILLNPQRDGRTRVE